MSILDDLNAAKAALVAKLAEVSANTQVSSYSVSGPTGSFTLSRGEMRAQLMEEIKAINELILMEDPYEIITEGF